MERNHQKTETNKTQKKNAENYIRDVWFSQESCKDLPFILNVFLRSSSVLFCRHWLACFWSIHLFETWNISSTLPHCCFSLLNLIFFSWMNRPVKSHKYFTIYLFAIIHIFYVQGVYYSNINFMTCYWLALGFFNFHKQLKLYARLISVNCLRIRRLKSNCFYWFHSQQQLTSWFQQT